MSKSKNRHRVEPLVEAKFSTMLGSVFRCIEHTQVRSSSFEMTNIQVNLRLILFMSCQFGLFLITSGRYRCTSGGFVRLGNSCYLFSSEIATWQDAHFGCRDHEAQLAVLATQYEDTTLRSYLDRPEFAQLGRWIGGIWAQDRWVWAAQGIDIESRDLFSSTAVADLNVSEQWMCLFMDPDHSYRWTNEDCTKKQHYICEAPLTKSNDNATATTTATTLEE